MIIIRVSNHRRFTSSYSLLRHWRNQSADARDIETCTSSADGESPAEAPTAVCSSSARFITYRKLETAEARIVPTYVSSKR